MTKIILIIGAVIIIGLFAVFVLQSSEQEPGGEEIVKVESLRDPNTITYSESGFFPAELVIQQGDTVTFRNDSSQKMWPATAVHPSHTVYPGSSIQKCFDEQAEKSVLFDACSDIEEGQEWSFMFNETGSWSYHNHRRWSERGTIIVE